MPDCNPDYDPGSADRRRILQLKYRTVVANEGTESELAKALKEEMRAFRLGDYESVARGMHRQTC